jgi:hypothetical protein
MSGYRGVRRPKNELHPSEQLRVEQAIARGCSMEEIIAEVGCSMEQAVDVRDWLDEVNDSRIETARIYSRAQPEYEQPRRIAKGRERGRLESAARNLTGGAA